MKRLSILLALLTSFGLIAAACGSDTTRAEGDTNDAAEAASDSEPDDVEASDSGVKTVTHKYGTVEVPGDPQRVVSVGFSDQDDLLALGVIPIGIRDWYGGQPFGTWPWAQEALGDAEPEVLPAGELNFEQIAALDPDLIIGVSAGLTEDEYHTLSAIAPTIAQSGDYPDYGMPWQERTRLIGEAVGQSDKAVALVGAIEDQFAAALADHPEFAGATAAVAFIHEDQPGAYSTADVRSRIMADLGFETPTVYDELAGDSFFASFSEEQIGYLEVDALVWLADTFDVTDAIISSPLRSSFSPALEGREIFVGDLLGGAFSFASVLSLGYVVETLVPELALAIDGDPSTVVPSAVEAGAADTASPGTSTDAGTGADTDGAMEALRLVFDSSVSIEDKAAFLEDAENLGDANEAYASAGESMGGIALAPTAAEITGETATVTYNVMFGGVAAYEDLTKELALVAGTWTVSRDEYCGFLASARVTCGSAD